MTLVAALWFDEVNVVVHLSDDAPVAGALRNLDGERDGLLNQWVVPNWQLEPVCSLLDRCGYTWAVDDKNAPRTWAERLFAEVARTHHEEVRTALDSIFRLGGDHDARAVLADAWARLTSGPGADAVSN